VAQNNEVVLRVSTETNGEAWRIAQEITEFTGIENSGP
jgi:hypothetical protein